MVADFLLRRAVLLILAGSLVLRVALALQGGQLFFGDEARVERGAAVYIGLRNGDRQLVANALSWPQHAAFTPLVALVTAGQHLLAGLAGRGDWSDWNNYTATLPWAAALLGLCSTLNLWLVHRLARAAGAGPAEANWVLLLAAASSALFYYSRHLLPYDAALTAALAGLWCAVTPGRARDFLAGACAALCYECYNGYWFLVPAVGAVLLVARPDRAARLAAGLRWAAGGLVVALLCTLPGAWIGGPKYWEILRLFSQSVNQGVFTEGWSLPWAYLWHAEQWLGAAVLAAIVAVAVREGRALPFRARLWLGLAAGLWLLLALASTGLERFVVYARTARVLVPFLALAGGYAAARWTAGRPHYAALAAGAVVLAAAISFLPHFHLVFPAALKAHVWRELGVPKEALTFAGCAYEPPARPVTRPELVLVNAQGLYPLRAPLAPPAGQTVFALPHPFSFAPYQYEGHTPRERRLLRTHDTSIRLVRLADPAGTPDRPPRAQVYGPEDYQDGRDRGRE